MRLVLRYCICVQYILVSAEAEIKQTLTVAIGLGAVRDLYLYL